MSAQGSKADAKQLSRSTFHMLKRAAQYASLLYVDCAARTGLTQRQYAVLLAVSQHEGTSQTALVKITGIDRSTLADLVARLIAQDYVQRKRMKDDGRTNTIRITAAGKKILGLAQPGSEDVDKKLLRDIPAPLRKPFTECLALFAERMDSLEKAGAPEKSRPRKKSA